MQPVKAVVKAGFSKVGLNVTRAPAPHQLSHHLRRFLSANDVNLVLDVGAHHGQYCAMLREEIGYRGAIVSFEPSRASFEVLRSRMGADRGWRGFQYGLSDTNRSATLNTFDSGDFNSLLALKPQLAQVYDVDTSKSVTETIQLHQLDTVWAEIVRNCPTPRVLVKIDTQGHDPAVFRGAANHLEHVVGVQTELPAVELYEGMTPMADALKLFDSHGYVPIGFFPVTYLGNFGIVTEFDVILKRFAEETVGTVAGLAESQADVLAACGRSDGSSPSPASAAGRPS
jgi:FkbM family methyltransferase